MYISMSLPHKLSCLQLFYCYSISVEMQSKGEEQRIIKEYESTDLLMESTCMEEFPAVWRWTDLWLDRIAVWLQMCKSALMTAIGGKFKIFSELVAVSEKDLKLFKTADCILWICLHCILAITPRYQWVSCQLSWFYFRIMNHNHKSQFWALRRPD